MRRYYFFDIVLQNAVKEQNISGNRDLPEGGFDGLMQVAVCDKVRRKHFKYETMRLNFVSEIEKYFLSFPNILFLKLLLLDTINLFSYQLLRFFIWDCLKKKKLFPCLFVFFEQVTWSEDGLLLLYQYLDRFCI